MEYANTVKKNLSALSYHGRTLSVQIDERDIRGGDKNWQAIKKGIPLRVEVGPKDIANNAVVVSRRDLPTGAKGSFKLEEFFANVVDVLDAQQNSYLERSRKRLEANTSTVFSAFDELKRFFATQDEEGGGKGFARVKWCGDESCLDLLKPLKLTVRCIPIEQPEINGNCIFTGQPATCEIIVAKAY
jgi:prolyl-tRNA synthetase